MARLENVISPSSLLCREQEVAENEETTGAGKVRTGRVWGGPKGAWAPSSGSLSPGIVFKTVECDPCEPGFKFQFCHLVGQPWANHSGSVLA